MDIVDEIQLSKIISHALRHEPQLYNLKLDSEGWVLLSDLAESLRDKGIKTDESGIIEMVERSEKKRHQILQGKIRAYYGHSTKGKIIKQSQSPPIVLYHGTIINNVDNILEKGLQSMSRQYVHLSINAETAKIVAMRRAGEAAIIKVRALEAYKNGIRFYKEENGIWLSEAIPSKYIYL